MPNFPDRVRALPVLGVGVSTEYGAANAGDTLDVARLKREHPEYAQFLEVGVEVSRGLDAHTRAWRAEGGRTTYHFLDINLDEPDDFDEPWLAEVRTIADALQPAWMCGDAGLWHFGRRERGHMILLPPVLSTDAATAMAEGVVTLRDAVGYEVLPENPPGRVFVGNLHLLDFFAQVCDRADTGQLLDCAHLAIYQRALGHDPLTGLDGFPLDRIVELHVAGGTPQEHAGLPFVDDTHGADVLPDTWTIFDYIVERAPNLRAIVFECERNPLEDTLPGFARIRAAVAQHPTLGATEGVPA